MTPMTRGSVMANTQRDMGSNPIRPVRTVSLVERARRDKGFEIPSTMGRYIEVHSSIGEIASDPRSVKELVLTVGIGHSA